MQQRMMNSASKIVQASTVLAEQAVDIQSADKWGSDFLVASTQVFQLFFLFFIFYCLYLFIYQSIFQGLYSFDGAGMTEIKMEKKRKFLQVNVISSLNIAITICGKKKKKRGYLCTAPTFKS